MSKVDTSHLIIRSVLMPLQGMTLILPNAAVSEVVSYQPPEHLSKSDASWLLGTQVWRQQVIPLIAFEKMCGMAFSHEGKRLMVAVCNTLNGNPRRPYVGFVLSDIPHLIRAHQEMIDSVVSGPDNNQLVRGRMSVNGEVLTIPDLDAVETLVNSMLA